MNNQKVTPVNDSYVVIGGAGFIGSHFVEYLLSHETVRRVEVVDNFSSGTIEHLGSVIGDSRLTVHRFDIGRDLNLEKLIPRGSTVIHLASNPDIAAAAVNPDIDFYQGTVLSNSVAEACRMSSAGKVLYASGSGVYGDYGTLELSEDQTSMRPVSTYGASKLAGEALFCSYAFMFDIPAISFRFGNVIGPKQTHGVGYDFVRRLLANPSELEILGDGTQSKTYVHVTDIVQAVLSAEEKVNVEYEVFNVGTDQYVTVNEIAKIACEILNLTPMPEFKYSGGNRGWKGDVPVLRLSTKKIRDIGWENRFSTIEALQDSISAMYKEVRENVISD